MKADRSDVPQTRFAALDPLRPPSRAHALQEGSFRSACDRRPRKRLRPYRNVRIAAGVLWQPLFVPSRGARRHKFTAPSTRPPSLPRRTNGKSGFEGGFSLPKGLSMLHRNMLTKHRSGTPDLNAYRARVQSSREAAWRRSDHCLDSHRPAGVTKRRFSPLIGLSARKTTASPQARRERSIPAGLAGRFAMTGPMSSNRPAASPCRPWPSSQGRHA